MAGASDQAEVPEPLVDAFMWGIEHSVCVLLVSFSCKLRHNRSRIGSHMSVSITALQMQTVLHPAARVVLNLKLYTYGYWSLVRRVTSPKPIPNPNPNPNVVIDLRNKETLNSFSYVTFTQ